MCGAPFFGYSPLFTEKPAIMGIPQEDADCCLSYVHVASCAHSRGMHCCYLGVSWQLSHFGQAFGTNITVFIFAYALH